MNLFRTLILLVALLGVGVTVGLSPKLSLAEEPLDCSPEDREIPGNTNSPCKWDFHMDEITLVEYGVEADLEGKVCYEVWTFKPYNYGRDLQNGKDSFTPWVGFAQKQPDGTFRYPSMRQVDIDMGYPDGYEDWTISKYFIKTIDARAEGTETQLRILNQTLYSLDSIIPETRFQYRDVLNTIEYIPIKDYTHVYVYATSGYTYPSHRHVSHTSDELPIPTNINDFNLLMNDCLSGIEQQIKNEAELEEVRAAVAAETLRKQRARLEAEAEAERQRLEKEGAEEALRLVRETELFKTQALIQQLEREKIIIGIWNEIVVERLTGARVRAEITGRYLTEIEANAAEFKDDVVAKVEELRRLEGINQAIADAIVAHNDEVETQLRIQEALEAQRKEALEDLAVEIPAPVEDATPTATPAPTATP